MISIFDKNIWFFSDPHYSHKNMCRGTSSWSVENTRNFATVEDMDTAIVNNINSVVGQNDLLFCLGDWNFGGIKNLPIFRHRINCKNVGLICGNHDNIHGSQWNPRIRVDHNKQDIRAADYFSYYQQYLEISVNKTPIILFHFPISSWNHMSKGSIHLFGHCHSKPEDRFFNGGKSMDVGLDGNNLMPYHIDEIFDLMKDRPVKKEGHH